MPASKEYPISNEKEKKNKKSHWIFDIGYLTLDIPGKGRGFTLIELMVTIAIIAILAAVGLAVYSNTQKSARDSKRKQDISSIAKALDQTRIANSSYTPPRGTMFTNGNIPYDPLATGPQDTSKTGCGTAGNENTNRCWYCIKASGASEGVCATNTDGYVDQNSLPDPTKYLVCANMEVSPVFYCVSNQL